MSPKAKRGRARETPVEDLFAEHLGEHHIYGWQRQVRFIPDRKFAADFYFADLDLAVEVDGGVYLAQSGHTSGDGYSNDRLRDNLALLHGIQTIRYTSQQVRSKAAISHLKEYLPLRIAQIKAQRGTA